MDSAFLCRSKGLEGGFRGSLDLPSALALYNYQTTLNNYGQGTTSSANTGSSAASSSRFSLQLEQFDVQRELDAQDASGLQALANAVYQSDHQLEWESCCA